VSIPVPKRPLKQETPSKSKTACQYAAPWGLIHELIRLFIQFRKIEDVERLPVGTFVDILGVVEYVNAYTTIVCDDGSELQKRIITLRDDSNRSIELTLWGGCTTRDDRLGGVRLPLSLTHLHLQA
jgi:hypothetical protein